MSDEVVTKLTIDADTGKADQYSAAMDRVADASERGLGSISNLNLQIAGVSIVFVAAAAAIKQGIDYAVGFNKQLADMATVAGQVGLSLKDMQSIQFGGQIAGLSDSQVSSGLEKSAQLLNDAQRNANSLSKLFDENGVSIKNVNGQLITENQLLGIAADLVSRARNPQDAIAIAAMVGLTKEWVPLLQQGSAAITGLGDEATRAGVIIDDATIQKATEFDAQWRKSSVEFSYYMRAALADVLPVVDDLIQRAGKFIKSISRGDVEDFAKKGLDQLSGATGLPEGNQAGGIKINADDFLSGMRQFLDAPAFSEEGWLSFGRAFANGVKLLGPTDAIFAGGTDPLTDATGRRYAQTNPSTAYFSSAAASTASFDAGLSKLTFGNSTKIPARDEVNDPVDRAINTLQRHTEQQLADAKAVGLGDAALAGFRAEAAETAAVLANGGKETDKQIDAFSDLKDKAIAAADALAKAKVAGQIDFGSKTALLTPQDVQIATQLKGIYPDVTTALNSAEAAQIRFNNATKDSAQAFTNAANPALVDFEMGTKSGSDAIKAFEQQFVKSLLTMINQLLIFGPMMKALQTGFSGFSLFGAPTPSAHGNVFSAGHVVPFALGGIPDIVDSPTLAPMALFGEGGNPEAIMPLKRGADGSLGVASSGARGGDEHHYYIDARGADSAAIARLQRGLVQLQAAQRSQGAAMTSMQYFNATGVSR